MTSSPTSKRPRTETEEEALKQEPRLLAPATPTVPSPSSQTVGPGSEGDSARRPLCRDAEFWYSDGSIILVAKDVEFRVYGGLLAEHSVLKAMFAEENPVRLVPLKGHRNQLTIPCPVIQLADTPEDLRHVLRVLIVSRRSTGYFDARKPSFCKTSPE